MLGIEEQMAAMCLDIHKPFSDAGALRGKEERAGWRRGCIDM